MTLRTERPVPFTKTPKPSIDAPLLPSWVVIVIFHTKLSPGRRARSASRTMSAASSARAGNTRLSRTTRANASLHMAQRLHDVQAGGSPRWIERGQRGRDDRETE